MRTTTRAVNALYQQFPSSEFFLIMLENQNIKIIFNEILSQIFSQSKSYLGFGYHFLSKFNSVERSQNISGTSTP